ncbi:MAG: hypothetical protein LQ348_006333 [Seirophora lacunosa]|nr:MAG: hypothetical protein LQ348_006333 [Seirophora lacunosa]
MADGLLGLRDVAGPAARLPPVPARPPRQTLPLIQPSGYMVVSTESGKAAVVTAAPSIHREPQPGLIVDSNTFITPPTPTILSSTLSASTPIQAASASLMPTSTPSRGLSKGKLAAAIVPETEAKGCEKTVGPVEPSAKASSGLLWRKFQSIAKLQLSSGFQDSIVETKARKSYRIGTSPYIQQLSLRTFATRLRWTILVFKSALSSPSYTEISALCNVSLGCSTALYLPGPNRILLSICCSPGHARHFWLAFERERRDGTHPTNWRTEKQQQDDGSRNASPLTHIFNSVILPSTR